MVEMKKILVQEDNECGGENGSKWRRVMVLTVNDEEDDGNVGEEEDERDDYFLRGDNNEIDGGEKSQDLWT